jgi:hypothetical protein
MQVSQEHVESVLRHARLTADQQRQVQALEYPADLDTVLNLMASFGITRDALISAMGGSP